MKLAPFLSSGICAALLSGCVTSENAGTAGNVAGGIAGSVASAAGLGWAGSSAIGYGVQGATYATVAVLKKYEASEQQKAVAQARAEAYMEGLNAAQKKEVKKKQRYIAVNTKKDNRIQGEKAVMVFDTKEEKIVGNDVYDIKEAPPTGSTAKFDTVTATYVGS